MVAKLTPERIAQPRVFTDADIRTQARVWAIVGARQTADMLNDLVARRQEVARLTAELDRRNALRERVHASFKKRDANDKCLCVYCTGDVEGLEELAANYKMDLFGANQRIETLKSQLAALTQGRG